MLKPRLIHMNYTFKKALFVIGILVLSLCHLNAEACPRISARKSVKALGAFDSTGSTLAVSISEEGVFRARVTLPETATGICYTYLFSRLRREDRSTGHVKLLKDKAKTGRVVQFRASAMPGVSREGDRAPSLTFLASTYCPDVDLIIDSDSQARFLDCGDSSLDRVEPSTFVKLLRRKLR